MSVYASSVYENTQSLREIEQKIKTAIKQQQKFEVIVDEIISLASSLNISESYLLLVQLSKNLTSNSSIRKKYVALYIIKKLFLTAYHPFYIFGSVRALLWVVNMAKYQAKKTQYERVQLYIKQLELRGNGDQVFQQRQCYKLLKFVQQFLLWFSENIPTHINAQYQYRSTFARAYQQIPPPYRKKIAVTGYQNFSQNQYLKLEQNFNLRKSHNKQLIKDLTQFMSLEVNTVISQQKFKSELLRQVVKTADSYCIKSIISQICRLLKDSTKLFCCLKLTDHLMNVGQIQFIQLTKLYIVPGLMTYILPIDFIQSKKLQRPLLACSVTEEKSIIETVCLWRKITQNVGLSTLFYDQLIKLIQVYKQRKKENINILNVQQQHIKQYLTNVLDMQGVNSDKKPHVQNPGIQKELLSLLVLGASSPEKKKQIRPLLIGMQPPMQQLSGFNRNLNTSAINELSQFKQSIISKQNGKQEQSSSSGGFAKLFAEKMPERVDINSSGSVMRSHSNSRGDVRTPKKGITVQSNKNISGYFSPEPLITFKDIQSPQNGSQNPPIQNIPSRNSFANVYNNNYYISQPPVVSTIGNAMKNAQMQKCFTFKQSLQIYNHSNATPISPTMNKNVNQNLFNFIGSSSNNINKIESATNIVGNENIYPTNPHVIASANNIPTNPNIQYATPAPSTYNTNAYIYTNTHMQVNNTQIPAMDSPFKPNNIVSPNTYHNSIQHTFNKASQPMNNIKQQSSFLEFNASSISKFSQYSNHHMGMQRNQPANGLATYPNGNLINTQKLAQNNMVDPLKQTTTPDSNSYNNIKVNPNGKKQSFSISNSRSLKSITEKSSQMVYFGRSEDFISYQNSNHNQNGSNSNRSVSSSKKSKLSKSKASVIKKKQGPVLLNHNNDIIQQKQINLAEQSTSTYKFDSSNISAGSLSNSNIQNFGKIGQQFPETVPKPTFGFKKKEVSGTMALLNKGNVVYENILGSQELLPHETSPAKNIDPISDIIHNMRPPKIKQENSFQSQIQDLSGGKHRYNQSIRLSEITQKLNEDITNNKGDKGSPNKNYYQLYKNKNYVKPVQVVGINNKNGGTRPPQIHLSPHTQYFSFQPDQNTHLLKKLQQEQQKINNNSSRKLKASSSDNNILANRLMHKKIQFQNLLQQQNVMANKPLIVHQVANDSHLLTLQQELGRAVKEKAQKEQRLRLKQEEYKLVKNQSAPFTSRKMEILKKQDEIIKILQNKKNEEDYYNNGNGLNRNNSNQNGLLIKPIKNNNKITDFFLQNLTRGAYIPVLDPFQRMFIKQLIGSRCLLLSNQYVQLGYNYSQIKNQISLYLTLFKIYDKIILQVVQNSLILQSPVNMTIQNQVSGYQLKIKRKVKGIIQPLNYFNNQPKFEEVINFKSGMMYKFPQLKIKLLQNDIEEIKNAGNAYYRAESIGSINANESNTQLTSTQYIKFRVKIPCSMFNLSTPVEVDGKIIQKLSNKKVLKSEPYPINPEFTKNYKQKIEKYFPFNMGLVGGWTLVGYKFPIDLLLKKIQGKSNSKANSQNSSSGWGSISPLNPPSGQFRNQATNELQQFIKFKINGGRTVQFQLFNNPKSLLTQTIVSMLCGKVSN